MARDITDAMGKLEALSRQRGIQLTEIRREVMEHLFTAASRPLSAYDLLERMAERRGRKLGPPTVYRALEFLVQHGLVSRIESRNAFVPCIHADHRHSCVFFVCRECSASVEVKDRRLDELLDSSAYDLGFRISRRVMELEGTCADCCKAAG